MESDTESTASLRNIFPLPILPPCSINTPCSTNVIQPVPRRALYIFVFSEHWHCGLASSVRLLSKNAISRYRGIYVALLIITIIILFSLYAQ